MIVYSCVWDARGVLSRVSRGVTSDDIIDKVMWRVDLQVDHKKCYGENTRLGVGGNGIGLQYIVYNGVGYLCGNTYDYKRRICFMYLQALMELHRRTLGNMRDDDVSKLMELYSDAVKVDKLCKIQSEINDVTELMKENIDRILERGESLESLERRASNLNVESHKFHRGAKDVRCRLCVENWKITMMIGGFVVCIGICGIILCIVLYWWYNGW